MITKLAIASEPDQAAGGQPERLWVLRWHGRVTLRQAHAVVEVDWRERVARTSCGLALAPEEIADVPSAGCMPCERCVAATPRHGSISA